MTDDPKGYRRSLRLRHYDYSQNGAYFVTICTLNKKCLLGTPNDQAVTLTESGKIIHQIWQQMPERFPNLILDDIVVMPNHVHAILVIQTEEKLQTETSIELESPRKPGTLGQMIGYFKFHTTKLICKLMSDPTLGIWQKDYSARIIRSDIELQQLRKHISDNPSNWELDEENPENANAASNRP